MTRRTQHRGESEKKPADRKEPPSNHIRTSKLEHSFLKTAGCENALFNYGGIPFTPRRLCLFIRDVCGVKWSRAGEIALHPAAAQLIQHHLKRRKLTAEQERALWTELSMCYQNSGL